MKRALLVLILAAATTASAQTSPAPAQTAPSADLPKKVEAYLRKLHAWGPSFTVKVGKPAPASVPGFYEVPFEVSFGEQSGGDVVYVSRDGRFLLRGELHDTSADPFAPVRAKIRLDDSPSAGPSDARVTVVDFSDFQCPHCRELDKTLREIRPLYPQVRFVSKNFPLAHIHPWAELAAIAGRCAYQQRPAAYRKIHEAIFDHQEAITPKNAWEKFVEIATATGLQPEAYRACLASPEAKQAVERELKEGQALRIANTPTVFVNGRRLVGGDRNQLVQYIEFELATAPSCPKP